MKNIAVESSDKSMKKILKILFQHDYTIMDIDFKNEYSNLVKREIIDLLLVDSSSLNNDRLKILKMIKSMQSSLPVIVLYDVINSIEIERELFNIADAMFRKPFNNRQLKSAVHNFLNIESDSKQK